MTTRSLTVGSYTLTGLSASPPAATVRHEVTRAVYVLPIREAEVADLTRLLGGAVRVGCVTMVSRSTDLAANKEWCARMAELEQGYVVAAGEPDTDSPQSAQLKVLANIDMVEIERLRAELATCKRNWNEAVDVERARGKAHEDELERVRAELAATKAELDTSVRVANAARDAVHEATARSSEVSARAERAEKDLAALQQRYDELHDQRHAEARKADDARMVELAIRDVLICHGHGSDRAQTTVDVVMGVCRRLTDAEDGRAAAVAAHGSAEADRMAVSAERDQLKAELADATELAKTHEAGWRRACDDIDGAIKLAGNHAEVEKHPTPMTESMRLVLQVLAATKTACAAAVQSAADRERGLDMYARAWHREVSIYYKSKRHEIDALVLATQALVRSEREARAELAKAKGKLCLHAGDVKSLDSEIEQLKANHEDSARHLRAQVEALTRERDQYATANDASRDELEAVTSNFTTTKAALEAAEALANGRSADMLDLERALDLAKRRAEIAEAAVARLQHDGVVGGVDVVALAVAERDAAVKRKDEVEALLLGALVGGHLDKATPDDLRKAAAAFTVTSERRLELLRVVEWQGCERAHGEYPLTCPVCDAEPPNHKPDCALDAALKGS